jgi:hypothetical protein
MNHLKSDVIAEIDSEWEAILHPLQESLAVQFQAEIELGLGSWRQNQLSPNVILTPGARLLLGMEMDVAVNKAQLLYCLDPSDMDAFRADWNDALNGSCCGAKRYRMRPVWGVPFIAEHHWHHSPGVDGKSGFVQGIFRRVTPVRPLDI